MKVILISAKQGGGKTTTADLLAKTLKSQGNVVYRTRYAKVLYEMHNAVRDIGRSYGLDMPEKHGKLLQQLGTELMRDVVGQDCWIQCTREDINKAYKSSRPDYVILDDCRFENELTGLDVLATAGIATDVIKIRLEADRDVRKARCDAWRDNENHPSETGLDGRLDDFNIIFDTTTGSAEDTVSEIVNYLNIRLGSERPVFTSK